MEGYAFSFSLFFYPRGRIIHIYFFFPSKCGRLVRAGRGAAERRARGSWAFLVPCSAVVQVSSRESGWKQFSLRPRGLHCSPARCILSLIKYLDTFTGKEGGQTHAERAGRREGAKERAGKVGLSLQPPAPCTPPPPRPPAELRVPENTENSVPDTKGRCGCVARH